MIGNAANDAAKLADINDNFWRILLGFPMLINSWMILAFLLFVREDSIIYSLSHDNEEQALRLVKKVYRCSTEENYALLVRDLKDKCSAKETGPKLGLMQAVWSPEMRRGTIIGLVITFLCQATG